MSCLFVNYYIMIKKIFSTILFIVMLFGLVQVNATTTSTSSWYNTRILDNSLNFKAEYSNGVVYTSWTAYNQNDSFKYYKVVRSTTVSDPIYPDNGYIKYTSNVNDTSYTDKSPKSGKVYYRVCAITNEMNRYCSNVVTLNIDKTDVVSVCTMEYAPVCGIKNGNYKTYSNKCMMTADWASKKHYGVCTTSSAWESTDSNGVSSKLRIRSIQLVNKLVKKIDWKDYTTDKKIEVINTLVSKLNSLASEKTVLKPVIDYIVELLNNQISKYQNDFSEIEKLFDLD